MPQHPSSTFKLSPSLAWRKVDEEVMVLNLETSFYYSLNETGARIWELLDQGKTAEQIAGTFMTEYDVNEKVAQKEVASFVAELKRQKFILTASR